MLVQALLAELEIKVTQFSVLLGAVAFGDSKYDMECIPMLKRIIGTFH